MTVSQTAWRCSQKKTGVLIPTSIPTNRLIKQQKPFEMRFGVLKHILKRKETFSCQAATAL